MFGTDEKITALLVKLNRLTSLDKIQWKIEEPPRQILRGTDDYIPIFLQAVYKNQIFALYQQRFESYDGERDRFYWNESEVLAILDVDGRVLWQTTQQSSALLDLFETARRKVANIDGMLDDLLSEDDDS